LSNLYVPSTTPELGHPTARLIRDRQDKILDRWLARVKAEVKSAATLDVPLIVNTIPAFLNNLAVAVDRNHDHDRPEDSNNFAQEHGGERARITDYSPDQVIQEYLLLRDVVLDLIEDEKQLDRVMRSKIQKSFDDAIQQAMMAFYLIYTEIRETLITHLTHDLRTPLTSAKMSVDMILRRISRTPGPLNDDIERHGRRAIKNIDYTNQLIQKILDQKHLDFVKVNRTENFAAAEMFSIAKSTIEDLAEEVRKQITVTGEKVNGFWDARAFRRVIENLVSNAVKYGREDGPIVLKVQETHGRVFLSVHNEGEPIPVQERELLFDSFQRSPLGKKTDHPGWGLGLAYCRQVAESHAGSIAIESSLDHGTTFTVDVPVDARNIEFKDTGMPKKP
jgi:signal transduction histidine kinase